MQIFVSIHLFFNSHGFIRTYKKLCLKKRFYDIFHKTIALMLCNVQIRLLYMAKRL